MAAQTKSKPFIFQPADAYNCTGFFESGTITIIGTVPQCCDSANLPGLITSEAGDNNTSVINLGNGEQNSITRSGSFEAEDDQILILTIRSDIKGGTVAFSLFSPDNKEQRITLGGSDEIKTIHLSAADGLIIAPVFLRTARLPL